MAMEALKKENEELKRQNQTLLAASQKPRTETGTMTEVKSANTACSQTTPDLGLYLVPDH